MQLVAAVCRAAHSRVCSLHSELSYAAFLPAFDFTLTSVALFSFKILFSFPHYVAGTCEFQL